MENKLISIINLFRQQDFFSTFEGDSLKIAEKIISTSASSYFGNVINLENEVLYEQILLSYDKEICWFIEDVNGYDLSDQVRPEMYIEVFKQLSLISKGQFEPKNIETKECGYCEGRDKRIIVRYNINDIETELVFCADGWALMLNFLEEVNESLEHSSHSFEYIMDAYGTCFVFFLNQNQKKYLTEELKWNFISYSNYWAGKALYYNEINNPIKAEECFKKAIIKQDNINSVVQYAIFLKENSRISESLSILEFGENSIDKLNISMDNRQWWSDFIDNQETDLKKQQNL
jgi:tetratricopeptide (TPR) repeat protein